MDRVLLHHLIDVSPPWLRRHWEDRLYAQEKGVSLGEYRQRTSALSAQLNQILSRTPQWQQWSGKDRAVLFRHWYYEAFSGLFVAELQKMSPQGLGRMLDRYTAIPPNSSRRGLLLGAGVVAYRVAESSETTQDFVRERFTLASLWQLWSVADQEDLTHLCSQLPQHEREELIFLLYHTNFDERD